MLLVSIYPFQWSWFEKSPLLDCWTYQRQRFPRRHYIITSWDFFLFISSSTLNKRRFGRWLISAIQWHYCSWRSTYIGCRRRTKFDSLLYRPYVAEYIITLVVIFLSVTFISERSLTLWLHGPRTRSQNFYAWRIFAGESFHTYLPLLLTTSIVNRTVWVPLLIVSDRFSPLLLFAWNPRSACSLSSLSAVASVRAILI